MDRIYGILLSVGYPPSGVDWLRRHRLATIILLALLAWVAVLGVVGLLWWVLMGPR